jgi:hypothetical protein
MLRVLMCEVLTEHPAGLHGQPTLGRILRYTLMTPERTAQMITSWAGVIPKGRRRRNGPPTVTVFVYGSQGTRNQEAFQIQPDHGIFVVTRSGPDRRSDPPMTDEAQAISELASELKRMAL